LEITPKTEDFAFALIKQGIKAVIMLIIKGSVLLKHIPL